MGVIQKVLLVVFHLGSSSPPFERPSPSRSAPSLDDFLKDWVVYYGDDGVTPSFGQTTPPPSTLEPSSTSEPSTTPNPLKFYIDQLKKKSDSNQEKKLRFYNMHNPVERLRFYLRRLVDKLIDWINKTKGTLVYECG